MTAAYDNASQKVTERTVERNFKAFRSYLERNIKALEFIPFYDLFSEEHLQRIRQLNSNDPAEATREALNIIEKLEEPGKYMHLINALEDAEYTKLVSVLKGYFVPVHGHHREVIRLSIRHMYNLLKPANILPHLLARKVISQDDFEKISNTERNQSRGDAAMQLMFILPDKIKDWYRLFLESLVDGDQKDLAELIDPERTKRAEETVTIVGKDVASPRSFKIVSDALTTPMTPYGDAEIGCPSERDTEEEIPTSASISEDARQIMSVDRDSSTVLPISTPVFVGISEDASLSKAGSSSVIPTFTSGFIRTTSTSGRLGSTAAVSTSFPSHSRQSSVVGSLETTATTVRKSTERKKKKVSHDDVTEAQFEVLQLQKEKLRAQTEKLVVQIKNIQLKNKKLERELADN